ALNRALFGRWTLTPLIATPLLYNYIFLVGLMNCMFGVGLALWAAAAWIRLRGHAWPLRTAVSACFVVALFFCHLYAVGVYGLAILAIEIRLLMTVKNQTTGGFFSSLLAAGLPFLPVLPALLASPTWQLSGENTWEPLGKLTGLMYVVEVYSDAIAFGLIAALAASAMWAARFRLLRFHPIGWVLLAVGCAVYLALPRVMFATYMADQRLPLALAYFAIACLHIDMRHRLVRRGF